MSIYAHRVMPAAALVRTIRSESRLSVRALAGAAGIAASTVHRIERGTVQPTLEMLDRIAEAAGMRLQVEPKVDYATSIVGLARTISELPGERRDAVRLAAELHHRFMGADRDGRLRMIRAEPPPIGDARWDAFVAGLAEWLAVRGDVPTPGWVHHDNRYLGHGWWVTPMASMRAWEYAGSPVSFQMRGVYIHRDSLTNV